MKQFVGFLDTLPPWLVTTVSLFIIMVLGVVDRLNHETVK